MTDADDTTDRAIMISSIKRKPEEYVKEYVSDDESYLYLSHDLVSEEFDVDQEKSEELVSSALDQPDFPSGINSRSDVEEMTGMDGEDIELVSDNPRSVIKRIKRGFSRQKKAWLIPGNFLAGVVAGLFIEIWFVQVLVAVLVLGDVFSAWFHGRLDIDGT